MIHSRRRLLRDISGSLLSGSLLMTEARAATAPLRTRWNGAADRLLVVEGKDVARMLAAGFEALPELEAAVRGRRIIIKPNATGYQPFPVTTDPDLIRLVISELRQRGARDITICDAPSYAGFAASRVFSKLGYFELEKRERVRVVCCDPVRGSDHVRVSRPEWRRNRFLLTNRFVQDSDLIINLAIPKRHHAADLSCALKNNFGCTADTFRTLAHLHEQDNFFTESLVEFADAARPDLTIVDARKMLTKSGPGFTPGKSEIKNGTWLLLSGDMVAVDRFCARLMETADSTFTTDRSVSAQLAYARALGLGDPDRVRVVNLSS
jgi:uncharacterized protein (DUF362 family)